MTNEFVIAPASISALPALPVYGFGGACKYPSEWTGTIIVNGGETATAELSGFTLDQTGAIVAQGSDKWGPSSFTGQISSSDNHQVTLYKSYGPQYDVVTLTGTLDYL
jgi:hypothetical protein